MLFKDSVDQALTLLIPGQITRDMNNKDTLKLLSSYEIIEKAKDCFLNQEITFDEYLDLCSAHDMNVDDYLTTVEHNLIQLKII